MRNRPILLKGFALDRQHKESMVSNERNYQCVPEGPQGDLHHHMDQRSIDSLPNLLSLLLLVAFSLSLPMAEETLCLLLLPLPLALLLLPWTLLLP